MWKISVVAIGSLVAACANSSLVSDGTVKIETESSRPITFSYAEAYREDGQLVIKGGLEYLPWVRFGSFTGHVDISVVKANGVSVERHDIEPTGRRIPRTIGRKAWFVAKFHIDTPPGTIVHIAYQNADHRGKI